MENIDKSITPEVFYTSISEGAGWQLDSKDIQKIIFSMIKLIIGELRIGKPITIPDFGTFALVKRKSRSMRNVNDGSMIKIPENQEVKFRPDYKLKKYFQMLSK